MGVLAGCVVKPISNELTAKDLTDNWAEQGIALLLGSGGEHGVGGSCLQSAALLWPPPPSAG